MTRQRIFDRGTGDDVHSTTVQGFLTSAFFAPLLRSSGLPRAAVRATGQGVVFEDGGRPATARKTFSNPDECKVLGNLIFMTASGGGFAAIDRATKRTVFVAKGQAEAEGVATLTREQAEGEFRRTIMPSLLDAPKHLMITADVALKSPLKPLQWAVKDALEAERRAPYAMCFALRGAFHHRKMNFFRANDARGPEFVIGLELKAFDAEHAIPELAKVANFIKENPCCDKSEFPSDAETAQHLQWLATTGHVVAFTNGVYSAVEKFPKYGPQWKKRGGKTAEAEKVDVAEEVKVEEKKDETAPVVAE